MPDGRSVTALLNATPIRSEDGEVESFVVTLQDMTPLEDMERLRAEFLGMISHELRTPLTSIRGSATTMQDAAHDLDAAELRQFLRIIVDQADNMRDLIDDLLDVARIETGALPVSPEPVRVAQLVDRARNTFLSGGGRNNLDISLDSGPAPGYGGQTAHCPGDWQPVVQRGKALPGDVRDQGEGRPGTARTSQSPWPTRGAAFPPSSCNGCSAGSPRAPAGAAEATTPAWASPSARALWRPTEDASGRIAEGASLGARFTFTIPIAEASEAPGSLAASARSRRQSRDESILVVDDDPQMLRVIRNALLESGYDPLVTADPEEALRLMQDEQPSLALLDMMLPGSDGIHLMRDIFSVADAPVIFLSAYGHDEVIARAFEAGASDYIVKPFTPTELAARVKVALLRREDRYRAATSRPFTLGDLTIDYAERQVTIAGEPVHLTRKEQDLLHALSANAGRVLTHGQLLRRLWGPEKPGDLRGLRTLVRRLRSKLGEDADKPKYIVSEPRLGYRMARGEEPGAG